MKDAQRAADAGNPPPTQPKTKFSPSPIHLYDVKLNHGDILIMKGDMQTNYLHSVKKETRKALANARRMNLTVRAFQQTAA